MSIMDHADTVLRAASCQLLQTRLALHQDVMQSVSVGSMLIALSKSSAGMKALKIMPMISRGSLSMLEIWRLRIVFRLQVRRTSFVVISSICKARSQTCHHSKNQTKRTPVESKAEASLAKPTLATVSIENKRRQNALEQVAFVVQKEITVIGQIFQGEEHLRLVESFSGECRCHVSKMLSEGGRLW